MVADILSRIAGGAILAVGGWGLGNYIADVWGPQHFVFWAFGLTIAGVAIGLIATPFATARLSKSIAEQTRSIPTSRLLSSIAGMVVGLIVALLVSIPLFRVPGWVGLTLPVAISLLLAYLGATLMFAPSRDIFHRFVQDNRVFSTVNGVVASSTNGYGGPVLLDTSAIIDGRIAAISKTGFLQGTLVVPRFILDELRHVADSKDAIKRARGRRGLEMLREIREEGNVRTEVLEIDYPQAREVDAKLVGLAKEIGASILTTDFNLNRVAQIDGIMVLNVNELASSLRPVVIPGESIRLKILHEGKEPGQGVGFLEDGTMVVVDSGVRYIDTELDVTVARVLQTAAGCMIFASPS